MTIKSFLILFLQLTNPPQEVPFKSIDDFEVVLDYKFRERPPADKPAYQAPGTGVKTSTGPLPYLKTDIKINVLHPAVRRYKIVNSAGANITTKKISSADVITIDWGFTEDVKDRLVAYEYTIQFLDDDKKMIERIQLTMEEDGTFIVNTEKRGKL